MLMIAYGALVVHQDVSSIQQWLQTIISDALSEFLLNVGFAPFFSALLYGADSNEHYILSALAVCQRNNVPAHR
jgi:hypothetical protein